MSFSGEVKGEVRAIPIKKRCCAKAAASPLGPGRIAAVGGCCAKAALRTLFIRSGSLSDPLKSYRMEIACPDGASAEAACALMRGFGMDAKAAERKGAHLAYINEAGDIADFLKAIGAGRSVFGVENARVLKDVRNNVNRGVNCESANIGKTVSASARQADNIRYVLGRLGEGGLDRRLAEAAKVRLEHAEMPIGELGLMADPPITKSGMSHRLRRLEMMAESLREAP
ncbi:MAG: DNA-binding protein WhiA [Oscillospiraceae bacterium]|nr:DNA-binding protein WhiA [Oscillospiraceae bacterium]